jgi:hypothetical protein
MTNWLIYSPFSKHSFWGKITDQMNRTSETVVPKNKTSAYFRSINDSDTDGKRGLAISHWAKGDAQFELMMHPATQQLTVLRPSSKNVEENEFIRSIDTEKIKQHLETHEWVAFGYIIVPSMVDRFGALDKSVYYTRDADANFLIADSGKIIVEDVHQPIQTWFTVTKASDDLYVMFCHPDVIIPNFEIDYKQDCFQNQYFTYLHEDFDFFEMGLKPKFTNAILAGDTVYSKDEFINIEWGAGSFLANNTLMDIKYPEPIEIVTDLVYTTTDTGIKIANQKGVVTLKYKVTSFLKPNIQVDQLGSIEKNYIILG